MKQSHLSSERLALKGRKALSEEKHKMEEDFDLSCKNLKQVWMQKEEVNGQIRLEGERQILDTRQPQIWRRKMEAGGRSAGLRQENSVLLSHEAEEGGLSEKAEVFVNWGKEGSRNHTQQILFLIRNRPFAERENGRGVKQGGAESVKKKWVGEKSQK